MADRWNSNWIAPGHDLRKQFGVFLFHRVFEVSRLPEKKEVGVSADQRYKLYVNGMLIGFGPQRGDLQHWFYETYDLAPYLKPGSNLIQVLVWNFGNDAPMAQISARTAFLLDDPQEDGLSTPERWEVAPVHAWDYGQLHRDFGPFYVDVGPGELVDASQLKASSVLNATAEYGPAVIAAAATERGYEGGGEPWMLIPRTIPPMRYDRSAITPVVRHGYVDEKAPKDGELSLLKGKPIVLADGENLLLDYQELLCAYPRITASGSGCLKFTYSESLWLDASRKENRNEVEGKMVRGYQDALILGDKPFQFEPLWWRTYRYLLIECEGSCSIDSVEAWETGYPLEVESSFETSDPRVRPIWDGAVRTVKRCAGETYFDCPYYEQLQYAGDTRIQTLIGYYLGRDRALQRAAVEAFHWSLIETGLTQSRYPSRQAQIIPPFSLWYLIMLADQRLYDRVGLPSDEQESRIQRIDDAFTELLVNPEDSFWNFADWVPTWHGGVPQNGVRSMIHRLTQCYGKVVTMPMRMDERDDEPSDEMHYPEDIEFERADFEDVFHKIDGLVREEGERPSEHAEALYRINQIELGMEPDPWPFFALERENAAKCTYYFSYYKHLAMQPDHYLDLLEPWTEMIESGLSTFAENPEPTRSDCHAWSAHPILGFFQIVAGVTSSGVGWSRSRIQPRPGLLRRFDAKIAHPDGLLQVAFDDGHLSIDSPVPFHLIWKGEKEFFTEGKHKID